MALNVEHTAFNEKSSGGGVVSLAMAMTTATDEVIVAFGGGRSDGLSATWNGTAITPAEQAFTSGDAQYTGCWVEESPAIGSYDLDVDSSNSSWYAAAGYIISGADTTTPVRDSDIGSYARFHANTTVTHTAITTQTTDVVIAFASCRSDSGETLSTSGFTSDNAYAGYSARYHADIGQPTAGASTTQASFTLSGSANSSTGVVAVSIQEAPVGGGATPKGPFGHPLFGPLAGPIAA